MSQLIVEVCEVKEVKPHPNADRLDICVVKGWEVAAIKGDFLPGQKCIYIPYDAVIPFDLANGPEDTPVGRLNVAKYCAPIKDGSTVVAYRVRAARLRGYKSFGIIMALNENWGDDLSWPVGTNVADHYKISKWDPPEKCQDGDAASPNPRFHEYTDIEKWQNYPDAVPIGTEVVLTEKIHGKNCRLGYVLAPNEVGEAVWTWMAGSHSIRRKEFDKKGVRSQFWAMFTDNIKAMLQYLASDDFHWHVPKIGIICFGEMYGAGVQDMTYGLKNKQELRVFDIAINEEYLDYDLKEGLLKRFEIPQVPVLYRGPFNPDILEEYTNGRTTLYNVERGFAGREGTVCTPIKEQFSSVLGGRLIIKSVSVDYLGRKNATDNR